MFRNVMITTCFSVIVLGFVLFHCQLPSPPAGPDESNIEIFLKSSDGKTTGIEITDTIGNQVQIRLIYSLTNYIDSAKIEIFTGPILEKEIPCRYKKEQYDTVYIPYSFSTPGTRTIKVTGYIKDYEDIVATVTLHVLERPSTNQNQKPVLVVPEMQTTSIGQTISFTAKATDPDIGQQVTIRVTNIPDSATFIADTFRWTPLSMDTGTIKVIFIATDNSTLPLSDTAVVIITVNSFSKSGDSIPDTIPPVILFKSPSRDTIISVDSCEIRVTCIDDSGCSVKGYRDGTPFDLKKSISTANLWTGIVKGLPQGSYSIIKIVARDSSASKNTDSLSVRVKYDNDKTGPVITLITPSKDSVTTSTSSYTIVLKVTDPSGVLSVNGASGAATYTGVKDTGSTWKINISTLENNKVTAVVLTATDSSLKANKAADTVYVKCEIINGYTITFDKNDNAATGTMAKQTINNGDSATLMTNAFTRTGWAFDGWATSPTGTVTYKDGASYKMGASDVILYAKWVQKPSYKVTFKSNGGTGTMAEQLIVSGMSAPLSKNTFIRTGYQFSGWNTDADGKGNSYIDGSMFTIGTIDTTLYATWTIEKYTITFNTQGGSNVLAQTVEYDGRVQEPAAPTRENYTFGGWYKESSCINVWNFLTETIVSNDTLFAKWTITSYTVTFNDQLATTHVSPVTIQVKAPATTISALPAEPKKTGYTFCCWNTLSDGNGTEFTALTKVTADITLYAIWKSYTYVVTFDGQSVVTNSTKEVISPKTTVETLPAPTAAGYKFDGWYTGINGGGSPFLATTIVTGNITVYAKWTRMYKVTYNANGGTGAVPVDPNTYQNGNNVTVLSRGSLTKQYFTFAGWNTQADTLGTNYDSGGFFPMGSADVVLYAKWRMDLPNITTQPASATCPVNSNVTFTVAATGVSLSYQWQKNNSPVDGATAPSYTPPALTVNDIGNPATYRCVVSNAGGSVNSNSATLGVATLTDVEGNVYHQVKIGTQVWTIENLKTTRYNDGSRIPKDTSAEDWRAVFTTSDSGKYCWYNNDSATNKEPYGALYNWYTVNTGKLAPAGWHVPTNEEWTILEYYLIANGYNWDSTTSGNKIGKSLAAKTDWNSSETAGEVGNNVVTNNRTGFSALPGGFRQVVGNFTNQSNGGNWWSATTDITDVSTAFQSYLLYWSAELGRYPRNKICGYSVRLVRD